MLFLNALKILPIQQDIVYIYLQILSVKKIYFKYSLYCKQTPRRYLEIWDLPNQNGYINDTINVSARHKVRCSQYQRGIKSHEHKFCSSAILTQKWHMNYTCANFHGLSQFSHIIPVSVTSLLILVFISKLYTLQLFKHTSWCIHKQILTLLALEIKRFQNVDIKLRLPPILTFFFSLNLIL